MSQCPHDARAECALTDEELAHMLEPLLRNMLRGTPKFSEMINVDVLGKAIISKMGLGEDTPPPAGGTIDWSA